MLLECSFGAGHQMRSIEAAKVRPTALHDVASRLTLAHATATGRLGMCRFDWCKPLDVCSYIGFGMAAMQRVMGGIKDGLAQGLRVRVPL
ncbi:MAG: hypothetical protein JM57_03935 [Comamonadaceae bacterium BICA1-1]|nr:MAG: hypothetical protein JM57_03935 [Comamonadaceae bacterium BICA1-1]